MHIPDNYLSPATCAVMGAAMVPVWIVSVKKVKGEIEKANLPLLGIGAAFSFLIMMFNVPVPGGTTAHAVGGTLIAVLFGPWAACISVSVALLIQALLFGDGGILAFGANSFNMAFVIPFLGYFIYKFISGRVKSPKGELVGLGLASYFAINIAALCSAIEFGLQPIIARGPDGAPLYCPYPLSVSIPAMTIPHLLVAGFVEVLFTVGVFAFIRKVSPGIIAQEGKPRIKAVYGLVLGLICLSPLGLLASGGAWGEWGIDEIKDVVTGSKALGFVPAGMERGLSFKAVFADYSVSGLPEWVGYVISALAGAAVLVIVFRLLALLKKGKRAGA
jgi:cobalt/nickel transport system permease protein